MLNWKIGLICLVFGLLIIAFSKMVSLGSISAAILFPVLTIFLQENVGLVGIVFSFLIAGLVVFNHRSNIKRIKEDIGKGYTDIVK